MQARGPLMIEHRLIERMIALMAREEGTIRTSGTVDPVFIDLVVDFIRTYADRTHHGKEEDILFRDLLNKPLAEDDREMLNQLIEEHAFARQTVRELTETTAAFLDGDEDALPVLLEKLHAMVIFYPKHIQKEDEIFFPAAMAYLSQEEQEAMIQEFGDFDRRMIHEKYQTLVEELGG